VILATILSLKIIQVSFAGRINMSQKKRVSISIAAGIVAALCATLFLWSHAQSATQARAEIIEQFEGGARQVLVAREQIGAGTVLGQSLFEEQTWPGMCLPEGTLDAASFKQIEGRRSTATILAGEALNRSRVFDRQLPLDRLAEGMTAVTLPADNVHALGGELLRGMRLTLMAATSTGRVTELATHIEVLSANISSIQNVPSTFTEEDSVENSRLTLTGAADSQSFSQGGESLHWVTLAIPNNQVEQVLTASRAGMVHLVLPKENLPEVDRQEQNDESAASEAGE